MLGKKIFRRGSNFVCHENLGDFYVKFYRVIRGGIFIKKNVDSIVVSLSLKSNLRGRFFQSNSNREHNDGSEKFVSKIMSSFTKSFFYYY